VADRGRTGSAGCRWCVAAAHASAADAKMRGVIDKDPRMNQLHGPLPTRLPALARTAALALALACGPLAAAPGDLPVPATPAAKTGDNKANVRTASLPGRGLFVGDQLSEYAKGKLVDLIIDAMGLEVEVVLLVPTGPWQLDGGGHTDRSLTDARMQSVRKFLTDRGVESRRIFVESRTDAKITEPRLDVQMVGRPAVN
jgi:OOP family OmpA-OmpF porin